MKEKTWKRNCPNCNKLLYYKHKWEMVKANRKDSKCVPCSQKGKVVSDEIKEKLKLNHADVSGKNNPMYGKHHTHESKMKIANTRKERKIPSPTLGKPRSDGTKRKLRLAQIAYMNKLHGQIMPNYNINSIPIIESEAEKYDIKDLQHAETPGGEFQVCGYFVDGYSKEKNIVIEYYEKKHKYQKERDERRQKEIEKFLGCEFIIIKE